MCECIGHHYTTIGVNAAHLVVEISTHCAAGKAAISKFCGDRVFHSFTKQQKYISFHQILNAFYLALRHSDFTAAPFDVMVLRRKHLSVYLRVDKSDEAKPFRLASRIVVDNLRQ